MVALAKYKDGYYKIDTFTSLEMLCVNDEWYYDEKGYEFGLKALPPFPYETVTFFKRFGGLKKWHKKKQIN